jgi:prepilin-type N-terminal cleavage/methylation domain-containing protein
MLSITRQQRRAFSLIELVIVVVIIGIIAAIAIPRMSRGAAGANDSALSGNLSVLRKAVDLYQAEHDGAYPALATFADKLTKRTKSDGSVQPMPGTDDDQYPFGPYLRAIPPLPVGANKGQTAVHAGALGAANFGWKYDDKTGSIQANSAGTEKDAAGKLYSDY